MPVPSYKAPCTCKIPIQALTRLSKKEGEKNQVACAYNFFQPVSTIMVLDIDNLTYRVVRCAILEAAGPAETALTKLCSVETVNVGRILCRPEGVLQVGTNTSSKVLWCLTYMYQMLEDTLNRQPMKVAVSRCAQSHDHTNEGLKRDRLLYECTATVRRPPQKTAAIYYSSFPLALRERAAHYTSIADVLSSVLT